MLCRLWQTRALVEYGSLDINRALRDYGYVGDLSFKDGRYFPSKAPLLSFAAVPIYLVLRAWGGGGRYAVPEIPLVFWSRFFITVVPTLVMLVYLRRFVRTYLSDAWADVITATYAVGSVAFGYSLLFISHQPTAVLLFGCFYALWRGARGEWNAAAYLAAGAFAGAAIACEYTSVLTLLPLVIYAVLELFAPISSWKPRLSVLGRALGLATIGAAPFVIALMLYHQACFGSPFETGYKFLNDPGYQACLMRARSSSHSFPRCEACSPYRLFCFSQFPGWCSSGGAPRAMPRCAVYSGSLRSSCWYTRTSLPPLAMSRGAGRPGLAT